MELTDQALKLMTPSGFDAAFFLNLKESKTHKEAYEKTESMYQSFFKKCRYSNFESYKKVRNMRISSKN